MMTEEIKSSIISFTKRCKSFYGDFIKIQESISNNQMNFDRHFSTFSKLEFVLVRTGIRISGGRLMLVGETMYYEIWSDSLQSITEIQPLHFELIEKYTDKIYRKTLIQILKVI